MNVTCTGCPAKYAVPDEKVRGKKVRITCKHCGTHIVVDGTTDEALAKAAAQPAPAGAAVRAPDTGHPSGRGAAEVKPAAQAKAPTAAKRHIPFLRSSSCTALARSTTRCWFGRMAWPIGFRLSTSRSLPLHCARRTSPPEPPHPRRRPCSLRSQRTRRRWSCARRSTIPKSRRQSRRQKRPWQIQWRLRRAPPRRPQNQLKSLHLPPQRKTSPCSRSLLRRDAWRSAPARSISSATWQKQGVKETSPSTSGRVTSAAKN